MKDFRPLIDNFRKRKGIVSAATSLRASTLRERAMRPRSLTRDGLHDHAMALAEQHVARVSNRPSKELYQNFAKRCALLDEAHRELSTAAYHKDLLTPGAEWLLDNYHIIQQQITDIREHFPKGYDRTLPKLVEGPYSGYPRVYHLALELLLQSDSVVDLDLLRSFIDGYQSASLLTMGELWAVPIMLRFALVENISSLAQRFLKVREERKEAERFVDEILGDETRTGTQIVLLLAGRLLERPDFLATGAPYLIRRLRERGRKAALTLQWLEEWLREEGSEAEEILRGEQYALAADQISIGNSVNSLKTIDYSDWKVWVESASKVDVLLRKDPAEIYSKCDFKTRDRYRHVIEKLAKRTGRTEVSIAEAVLRITADAQTALLPARAQDPVRYNKESHVGYYLVGKGRRLLEEMIGFRPNRLVRAGRFIRTYASAFYIGTIFVFTALLVVDFLLYTPLDGAPWQMFVVLGLLLLAPISDVATNVVQWIVTHVLPPDFLPKLELKEGIPDNLRTIVVVHSMFTDGEAARRTIEGLEVRYLGNSEPNLVFGVLADLADAKEPTLPNDRDIMEYSKQLIDNLRRQYPEGQFFILFRTRQWNASEQKFMAWERKRGKLEEFNKLLLNKGPTSFIISDEDRKLLKGFRYVITLDNDSQLPRGSAKKLIGTIAHPLNVAVLNQDNRCVADGYSVIQPRMGISLVSAHSSRFAEIFSGHAGLDPYTQTVSEVYQDLFREGSYIGKGIYDLQTFAAALDNRVPENTLLSHDLFEGLFCRVALATDIELFDDFPSRYHVHARRHHRWVRGDWQLVPWLFPVVRDSKGKWYRNPINALGRWKLFDNLRRSLIAPSLFLLLWFGWSMTPAPSTYWTAVAILTIAFPVYANFAQAFLIPTGVSFGSHFKGLGRDLLLMSKQALYTICFLPHQAFLMLHAIAITLARVFITKRRLLEWETAYHSERRLGWSYRSFFSEMSAALILASLAVITCTALNVSEVLWTLPVVALWISSPVIAKNLSMPIRHEARAVTPEQGEYLYDVAWKTWRYFRQLVSAQNNYLPPDNIQLVPERVVAPRTSPTNISLSILGTISAYDCGFFPLHLAAERLSKTFDTLTRLERYRGHFLNWYHTETLEGLRPKYVSTVDSGNLVAHFVAVRTALRDFLAWPAITAEHVVHASRVLRSIQRCFSSGSAAVLEPVRKALEHLSTLPATAREVTQTATLLRDTVEALKQEPEILNLQPDAARECSALGQDLSDLIDGFFVFGWLPLFENFCASAPDMPELDDLRASVESLLGNPFPAVSAVKNGLGALQQKLGPAEAPELKEELRGALEKIEKLEQAVSYSLAVIEKLIHEVDFRFLYDEGRDLFVIGYHVDNAKRDSSYYDLLASEARLTSLVAIAFGQVPQQHWFSLGRPLTDSAGGKVLLSWSGTMFEYLMPLLVTRDYPGTLLGESYHAVVKAQQAYSRRRSVPWGISESGYSGVDFEKTYQYRAFGVPGLGLKRGLEEDLVISPYSTCLALQVALPESYTNLLQLERIGLKGEYGLFEAADFTQARLTGPEKRHIVQNFLAHHQGMSLVAINNVLHSGIFQTRFHVDAQVKATELLLHEKFPERLPILTPHAPHLQRAERGEPEETPTYIQAFDTPHTAYPRTHLLSNGRYSIMVDNAGSGYSLYDRELSLTRWSEDGISDAHGSYVYIRDVEHNDYWSATHQPTLVEAESYEAVFSPDKAEFKRRDFNIFTHQEITVSPEEDVEIRKIAFTNLSSKRRVIEVTSYGEVVLNNHRGDATHPAFSKMFVESELLSDLGCLLFTRRPRSKDEDRRFFFHMAVMPKVFDSIQVETSRFNFIGRGNSLREPEAMASGLPLSGTAGFVLDPVFAIRVRLEIGPGQTESVNFINGFARSREEATALASRYRELHRVSRAFEMAWSQASVELRNEQVFARQSHIFQQLGNMLIFNIEKFRAEPDILMRNRLGQPNLWRFGISGDLPICMVRITEPDQTKIVRELLQAHHYLRMRGLSFDLVILNEYPGGYLQNLQEELEYLIRSSLSGSLAERKGGIFLRTSLQVSEEERELLQTVARVVFSGYLGSLASQVKPDEQRYEPVAVKPRRIKQETQTPAAQEKRLDLELFNGYGGYIAGGKAYSINVGRNLPPLPWSNIVCNPHFGFLATESGATCTWSDNSRENRLSSWSNDPVCDPSPEVIYIRDAHNGAYWCPTPRPVKTAASYNVEHHFGYTSYQAAAEGIESTLTLTVAPDEKVKWFSLKVRNTLRTRRQLELYFYVEWVLGVLREEMARYHVTGFEPTTGCVYATNHYNHDFPGRVVFAGSTHKVVGFTTSRGEFIGRNRDASCPVLLERGREAASAQKGRLGDFLRLSRRTGAGFDSCALIKVFVTLDPRKEEEVQFFLGETLTKETLKRDVPRYASPQTYSLHSDAQRERMEAAASCIEVHSPERSFDILVNGWLPYQILTGRLFGRTAFYQSSGAYGFRDQLQDVMALLPLRPDLARNQILLHASRQFPEGDVQHWWHPPMGRGSRTRMSDDFLWLPYVVAKYVEVTGNKEILDETAGFIEGPQLQEHEHEAYIQPRAMPRTGTIFEHCLLALEHGMRFGSHQLPLMGIGDWNDGMNDVGRDGKGESVWLGWFLITVIRSFLPILEERGEEDRASRYRATINGLREALERDGWDGKWYRRAYFDDGTPLGSEQNDECKIDSLPQSWAVICGEGDRERARSAISGVYTHLVNIEKKYIALLTPPFNKTALEPGYIKGYPPATRENGGQYTHAAAWVVIAEAILGHGDTALKLFQLLNPVNHTLDRRGVHTYKGEPYVLAGDVYAAPPYEGRAGWTWYTGSAGWMYQAAVEYIIGLKIRGTHLTIDPCVPAQWREFSFSYRAGGTRFYVRVENPAGVERGVRSIEIDGQELADKRVEFNNYRDRAVVDVRVVMG